MVLEGRDKNIDILVKGLASIASNFGRGGLIGTDRYQAELEFRRFASRTLHTAGYNYYECCGKSNIDGWFTQEELQKL